MDTAARLLGRLSPGYTPAELEEFRRMGLKDWLRQQLAPSTDEAMQQRLQDFRLRIKYMDGKDGVAVDEMRPLQWLEAPIEKAGSLFEPGRNLPNGEKARPRQELQVATALRQSSGRQPLRELICDFWHNHFNVNGSEPLVSAALPTYDREVIRPNCFGNFRQLLEAVARSAAMLVYLNNRSSRTGAPNENYARELFELHTLGRDAYLNGLYNRWRDVPGAKDGAPTGYIDQDVYEAARAFTGWAIEDGSNTGSGQTLPRKGGFVYVEAWHDPYQKRVLGAEFDPYQPALSDGRKVLDLAAFHPATARHLCTKLCQRLVADEPAAPLVESAIKVWQSRRDKPDQIARVVEHILLSDEFRNAPPGKIKRPLELLTGFVRATGLGPAFTPTEPLAWELENAGQRLYTWATPTGHPDRNDYWLGANALRRRWNLIAGLCENWWNTGPFDPFAPLGQDSVRAGDFIRYWQGRLFADAPPHLLPALLNAANLKEGDRLGNPGQARRLVGWMAMSPEYQWRGA